jgi:pseudaminic acid cytidylyltransferase
MSNLAIIPARGGSKRIPRKNIKDFLGKPIIAYSIEAAQKSGLFEEVMVSTDNKEIVRIAEKYRAKVPFMRSNENSNDYAGLSKVCLEVVNNYLKKNIKFDYICCILSTAPFIKVENLIKAKNIIEKEKYDCVFTLVKYDYPIQRSFIRNNNFFVMKWPENISKRSQDIEESYHDAGQFYFIKTSALLKEKKLFTKKSGAVILRNIEAQDIDTEDDWKLAEIKYKFFKQKQRIIENQ